MENTTSVPDDADADAAVLAAPGDVPDDLPRRFVIREFEYDDEGDYLRTSVRLWGVELPGGVLGFSPCRTHTFRAGTVAHLLRTQARVADVDLLWIDSPHP